VPNYFGPIVVIVFVDAGQLESLLIFCTGSDTVPALGFEPEPSITFGHDVDDDDYTALYPVANTCTNNLRLPILVSYDKFSSNMLNAISTVSTFTTK